MAKDNSLNRRLKHGLISELRSIRAFFCLWYFRFRVVCLRKMGLDPVLKGVDATLVKAGALACFCNDGGLEVSVGDGDVSAFIRRSDLSRDRAEQRPERFSVGDKVDVRITNVDAKTRRLGVSVKAREIAEEKEAVEQYGSSDSGASLGDILGAALKSDD